MLSKQKIHKNVKDISRSVKIVLYIYYSNDTNIWDDVIGAINNEFDWDIVTRPWPSKALFSYTSHLLHKHNFYWRKWFVILMQHARLHNYFLVIMITTSNEALGHYIIGKSKINVYFNCTYLYFTEAIMRKPRSIYFKTFLYLCFVP